MLNIWRVFRAGRGSGAVIEETRFVPVCSSTELPFGGNYASTTKYTVLSYLPKALFEQYRRVANVFFTLMAALSLTPWSPVRPWTTWTPLVLVVGVSMVKEAREDYKRYRQDLLINNRQAKIMNPDTGVFVRVAWQAIRVGDLVVVGRDEPLPADLVLLASSNPEGSCYVETMNLDGETNLKMKSAPEETRGLAAAGQILTVTTATIECEPPNSRLYTFTGNLRLRSPLPSPVAAKTGGGSTAAAAAVNPLKLQDVGGPPKDRCAANSVGPVPRGCRVAEGAEQQAEAAADTRGASMFSIGGANSPSGGPGADGSLRLVIPLSASSLLLRGCSVRNTDCVYGVVVYAGHDTKIFMNSTEPPSKRSSLERYVDRVIVGVFVLLFSWCLVSAVFHTRWTAAQLRRHWYMRPDAVSPDADPERPSRTGAVNFFVALLLYSYLVPISLYVSIEMVKVFQSMVLIPNDRDMYHPDTDTPAMARTSNLNEELGQVAAVMTDKTGTLTRNVMEFFKCSIGGVAYGAGVTEIQKTNMLRQGPMLEELNDPRAAKFRERYFNFYDERLMGDAWFTTKDADTIEMFFRLLAVCHTVIPEGPPDPATIKYEAESPDEAALVVAAKVFGFFFHRRTQSSITVRERGQQGGLEDVEYEVLNVLEFNSTRKRMSVVIKHRSEDKIIIFTKGADTVIYERLDPNYTPNEAMKESTGRHMEEFGAAGLRTLCLSYAEVDRDWYNSVWLPEWVAAKTSLEGRDEKVAEVSEKIERNLRLLGCTAIEDKLQEGVPQCIKQLALAGIRIWVLTGDKMETAINIGYACSLLREDMMQYKVSASSHRLDELEKSGSKELAEALAAELVAKQLEEIETCLKVSGSYSVRSNDGVANAALIIDGKALSYALAPAVAPLLLCVGLRCSAVVCCRVSPLQKSQVTALVRAGGSITLAIGDGANDVGMIQRAHIGVGISGQEGMQAVMSSDFAIAQFRFLVPLLLVHGQYSYRRLSRMISFFFYKNLLFALTLFTYSAFTTFSGSYIYNDTSMTLFNVVFTSATPLVIGMFDRHLAKSSLLHYPQLYRCGVANEAFSLGRIAAWLAAAAVQAGVLLAMVLVGASGTAASGPEGIPYGMAQVGAVLFTAVLLTVHLQLAILEEEWTVLHHAAIWGSLGIWFLYLLCFGALPVSWSLEMWQLFRTIVGPSAQLWLLVVVIPVVAVLPVMAIKEFKRLLFPSDEDVIREMSTLNGQRKQQQRRLGLQQHRSQHRHQQQQKERQKLDQRLEKGPEIDELKPGMRIETKDQQKQRQQQPQDGQEQQPPVGPHIGRVQQVGQQQGLPSPQPPSRLASFHEAISKGFSSGKCMLGRGSGRGLFGSHRIAPDSQAAFAAAEVSAAVKSDVAVTAAASPAGDAITSPSIAAADAFGIEATATTTTAPGPVATPSTASKGGRSSHDSPVAEVNSPRGGSGTAGAALVPATAGGDMVAAADSDGGGGRVTGSGAVNSDDTVVVREPQALALSFSADPSEIIMAALGGARPPPLPEPLPLLVTVSGSTGTNAGGSATLSTRGRHSSLVARPDWRKPLLSWGQTNKGLRGPGAKFVISSGSSGGMPPGLLPGDSVSAAGGEDAGISERPRAVSLPPGAAEPQIKSAAVLAALPAPSKPRRISLLTPVLSLPRGGSLSPMTSLPRVPSFPPMSSFRASAVGSGASISTISGMLPTTATSVSPIPRGLGEGRNPSPEPAALQEREGSHCTGGRPVTPRQLGAAPSADWPPVLPVPIAALPPTTETPQLFFAKLKYSTSSYCSSTRSPSPPIAAATAAVRRLAEEAVGAARNEPMAAFDATSAAEAEGMGSAAGVNTAAISFTRVRSLHRTSDGRFTESSLSGRITESGIIQLTSGLLQGHAGPDTDSGMLLGRDSEPSSQMSLALLQGDGVRDAMLALDDVSS